MTSLVGVSMPQNDKALVDQIIRDYENDAPGGIPHGLQKDAIQNGIGAANSKSYRDWTMCFELITIDRQWALVFWDEGTCGLTGELLATTDIENRMNAETLGPNDRYARFMSRFVSGGNYGPGMFGRGKLVFTAASKKRRILIDSYRNDGQYIATERWLDGVTLKQLEVPKLGSDAHDFIKQRTSQKLQPLKKPGTRITIFNIADELVEYFNNSFLQLPAYKNSMAYAIEETWWELLLKYNLKIALIKGSNQMDISLNSPLSGIINAKDGIDSFRAFDKQNIPVTIGGTQYRIKQIKLVVSPEELDDDLKGVWVQRKGMKIGSISRNMTVNNRISNRLSGFMTLESDLEQIIENAENPTHYGLIYRSQGMKQLRDALRSAIDEFESALGLSNTASNVRSQKQLMEVLKELNDAAQDLGLATQDSFGLNRSLFDIIVKSLLLPTSGTLRVDFGENVGPIEYEIHNHDDVDYEGKFTVCIKQTGITPVNIHDSDVSIGARSLVKVGISAFSLLQAQFVTGKATIEAVFTAPNRTPAKAVRTIFIGEDPIPLVAAPVSLILQCRFPHADTRRLEITDVLSNISVKVTNNTAHALKVNLRSVVRYAENKSVGRPPIDLFDLCNQNDIELPANSELLYAITDIIVDTNRFAPILQSSLHISERTCEIYAAVHLRETCAALGLRRAQRLNKATVRFYLEVDPPGQSIFSDVQESNDPTDVRQSWYKAEGSGYTFFLNIGHPTYIIYEKVANELLSKQYKQQQMITQAYMLAIENDIFKGNAAEYKAGITDQNLAPIDIIRRFSEMLGMGLFKAAGM